MAAYENLKTSSLKKFFGLSFRHQYLWMLYLVSSGMAAVKFHVFHSLNILNLRLKGVLYGKSFSTFGLLIIDVYPGSTVSLGNDVTIVSDRKRATASTLYSNFKIKTFSPSSEVTIGNHVGMTGTSITCRSRKISIGDNCGIGPNVVILDSDFHIPLPYGDWFEYPGFEQDADVIIGNNVFIGLNSIVLKGVHIGNNCVVAAGSVVVSDIPSDSLAAGVPARVVKKLNCDDKKPITK
jgi:acetyltransferase-like isoleucine patch superfamily enzyme